MKSNSPTEAGQTKDSVKQQEQLVDAINQTFALFKLNYHNQFLKAFAQESDLIAIKRMWLDSLKIYSSHTLLLAAKAIVNANEFLPTLKTMRDFCEQLSGVGLPDIHAAYVEACCASTPKTAHAWSHPAVYFAGKEAGWHFLQSHTEDMAFPVFKKIYQTFCNRVRSGEILTVPEQTQIEKKAAEPASKETKDQYLTSLKSLLEE